MSIEGKISFPPALVPALTPQWFERQKEPNHQEKEKIDFIKSLIAQDQLPIRESYQDYQRKKLSVKEDKGTNQTTETSLARILNKLETLTQEKELDKKEKKEDLIELAWLIRQFQDFKREENENFSLFDEQILALVRLVDHYQNTKGLNKGGGLVEELKTGEGKTSVVIPVFLAWLGWREERIHVHEINPYLLHEGYQSFLQFARFLGIDNQVGIFNLSQPQESQEKRFLFGYWSDFIHWYQFSFLQQEGFPPFPKNPILVLDEVDQLLQDESATPAVISQTKKTEEFLTAYLKKWRQELTEVDRPPFHFQYRDKKGRAIRLTTDPKDYDSEIRSIKDLVFQATQFYNFLKAHDPLVINELKNQGLLLDRDNKREWWLKELDRRLLEFLATAQLRETPNEDLIDDPNFLKELRKTIERQNFLPWWSDSEFQQTLINAFFMEKGRDYLVEENKQTLQIKPLALSTGYTERGKHFNDLIPLFLVVKEQWQQGIEPEKMVLPETITIEVDRLGIADFYQKFNRIYGFTGTASSVARRLLSGYNLKVSVLRQHFPTNRKENAACFVNDFNEVSSVVRKFVSDKNDQRNVLIVVNSPEEASLIQDKICGEDLEINILSADNENDDKALYQWISHQEEKRRVLITVKMIGRGVDLQPTEKVKNQGFLLISTTPLTNERAYQQLIGRVGRRGEKGEIVLIIHPNDPLFSTLSPSDQKKLNQLFKEPQRHEKEILGLVKKAWESNEEIVTERLKGRRIYNSVINYLRNWLEEPNIHLPFVDPNLENDFRRHLRNRWIGLIWHLENTFFAWAAAGQLGPFGQGRPEGIFTNYFFKLMENEIYPEFLKSRGESQSE